MNRPIYEVDLLDDLHRLFPEILYDNTLFSHDSNDRFGNTLSWIRYRLSMMFPQTFTSARQNYNQHLASQRRNEFEEWMWLRRGSSQDISRTRPEIAPSPITVQGLSTRVYDRDSLNQIINNTVIDELLGSLLVPRQTIRTNFSNFFDSIPLIPTENEINIASEIVDSNLLEEVVICTICQENESPRDISGTSLGWRKLRGCDHIFHRNCIDRWFESHVICPVCRSDIREIARQYRRSYRPSTQSAGATGSSDPSP